MNKKCVLLLSGGLDSVLAAKIMLEQGIEVEGLNFKSVFGCCKDDAFAAGRELGINVTLISKGDEYYDVIANPKHGYGSSMNPCVDCRIFMFSKAKKFMKEVGASFIVSGEVVGQRPNSQLKHQLGVVERGSDLDGLLLRPLSAKLLDATKPELEGIVDREKLYGIAGRSRKELHILAKHYGIKEIPTPSNGCVLTDKNFGDRVKDLFAHQETYGTRDFQLLRNGRHFRIDEETKVIVGRDEKENEQLSKLVAENETLLHPVNFTGPDIILQGELNETNKNHMLEYFKQYTKNIPDNAEIEFLHGKERTTEELHAIAPFICTKK